MRDFWKTLRNKLKVVNKSQQIKSQNFLAQDGQEVRQLRLESLKITHIL